MRAGILFYYTREVEKPTPLSETDYYLLKDLYLNATWSYEQYNEIFEEKMTEITIKLSDQFKKSKELEDRIKKNLKNIGFEIK
jgi:type I restriction enzyme M protein